MDGDGDVPHGSATHERWHAIAETIGRSVAVGVIVADAESGASLLVNEHTKLLTGRPAASWSSVEEYADLDGRSGEGRAYAAQDWPLVRAIRQGEHVVDEPITITRPDGELAVLVSAAPVRDDSGAIIAGVQTMADADDRHVAGVPREALLATLSHEIRTPLTAVLGDSELLLRVGDRLPPETREGLLQDTVAAAERLRGVVDNLMVVARADVGLDAARHEPLRIAPILERTARRARATLQGPPLSVSIEPGLPLVLADESSVEHVVSNLLTNAVTHGGEGSVLAARREGDEVLVTVTDGGPGLPGMPAEDLFRMFATRPTPTSGRVGLGLGLFVAARLVAAMGGRIWGRDLDGAGAEFGLAIPVLAEPLASASAGDDEMLEQGRAGPA